MGNPENRTNNHGIRIVCGNGGFGMQNVPGVERTSKKDPTDSDQIEKDTAGVDPEWVFNGKTYVSIKPNS